VEDGLEAGIVVFRMGADHFDDASIAVGRFLVVASRLVDHAEAVPAVVGVGEAFEQMAGDLLGFVEPALVDEIDGGIGIGGEFVLGIVGIDVNVGVELVEAVDDIDVAAPGAR